MSTKTCKVCQKELELENFRLVGKYYRNTCRRCEVDQDIALQKKLREYVDSFRTKCAKCGDTRTYLLDFHHKDSNGKEFTVSTFLSSRRWSEKSKAQADEEISKCVVLCANCHREFHFIERNEGLVDLDKYLSE